MRGSVRQRDASSVLATLSSERSVVVTGPPGSGRTSVCHGVEAGLLEVGRRCLRLRGRETVEGVPYAAFAPLLSELGLTQVDGLTVLTRVPGLVAREQVTLVVDDADMLDPASLVLVGQIARGGSPVVLSAGDVLGLPQAIRDAVDAGAWQVHPLQPLDVDDILAIAAGLAGEDLDARSAAQVVVGARGNLRRAVMVVEAMLPEARQTPAGVSLGPLSPDEALRRLVSATLSDDERPFATLLAATGPLPQAAFTTAETHLFTSAIRCDGGLVGLADPLLGDLLYVDTPPGARAGLCRAAAERLEGLQGWEPVRTLLQVRGGDPVGRDARLAAAQELGRRHCDDEALELLDGLDDDPDVMLERGAALSDLGRIDEALPALWGAAESGPSSVVSRAARELGLLHAVRRGDPATAVSTMEALIGQLSGDERREVETELIKWRLMAGQSVPDPRMTAQNASLTEDVIGAMLTSLGGPLDAALLHVERGRRALEEGAVGPPYSADLLRLSAFLIDVFAGRLAEAALTAKEHRDRAVRLADPSLGMWEMATAEMALHDGRHELSYQVASRAERHLTWHDFTGLRPTTVALRAAVAARTGRPALATELAAQAEPHRADVKVDLHVARVEAELLHRFKDNRGAAKVLAAAGRRAIEQAHQHLGLLAIDEAVMLFPSDEDVAVMVEHTGSSALFHLLADRAQALLAQDATRLLELVDDLEKMGQTGRAAHAAFRAARLFSAAGHTKRANRARGRGVVLASRSTRWACDDAAESLTKREAEVATLAARRMRSREIAQQLGVSTRTVDNHLGRAFRKLGVTNRDELPEALGL